MRSSARASGVPVSREVGSNSARRALEAEIGRFVAGRLVLILLPIRAQLKEVGLESLAVAVQAGVQDIELNLSKILIQYEVSKKTQE